MNLLVVALLAMGYTLVYAATAAGGQFAKTPWRGFYESAYDVAAAKDKENAAVKAGRIPSPDTPPPDARGRCPAGHHPELSEGGHVLCVPDSWPH